MSARADAWQSVPDVAPSADLDTAKAKAKGLDLGSGKRWAADRAAPGNGVTRVGLVCNNHEKCSFKLLVKRAGGAFCVYMKGEHSESPTFGKRSNSALDWSQSAFATSSLKTGSKPAEILAALTDDKLEEAEAAGTPAQKRLDGGLEGAWQFRIRRNTSPLAVSRGVFLSLIRVFSHVPLPCLKTHHACVCIVCVFFTVFDGVLKYDMYFDVFRNVFSVYPKRIPASSQEYAKYGRYGVCIERCILVKSRRILLPGAQYMYCICIQYVFRHVFEVYPLPGVQYEYVSMYRLLYSGEV